MSDSKPNKVFTSTTGCLKGVPRRFMVGVRPDPRVNRDFLRSRKEFGTLPAPKGGVMGESSLSADRLRRKKRPEGAGRLEGQPPPEPQDGDWSDGWSDRCARHDDHSSRGEDGSGEKEG